MPRKDAPAASPSSGKFKQSLTRNTVIQVLLLALIPVILVSVGTLWSTQRLITDQLDQQFASIAQSYSTQLTNLVDSRQTSLRLIKNTRTFANSVDVLLDPASNLSSKKTANMQVLNLIEQLNISRAGELVFDEIILIKANGEVVLSTNPEWDVQSLGSIPAIQNLIINTNSSAITFNLAPLYNNKTVIITSQLYISNDMTNVVTLMGFTLAPLPSQLLANVVTFFPTGQAYYYTPDEKLVTYDAVLRTATELEINPDHKAHIASLLTPENIGRRQNTVSVTGQRVINYTSYISPINSHLILEIPQRIYLDQLSNLLRLNLIVLSAAALIVGVFVFISTRRLTRPLVQLANISTAFAKGDWTQRAVVNRNDEIGLLASSFNTMVDELSDMYRSLEVKVEERVAQLKKATGVAQMATSTSEREVMTQRTAQLIVDRFGYHFASVFLVDETGNYATIKGVAGQLGQIAGLVNQRITLDDHPQISEVVKENHPVVTQEYDRTQVVMENVLLMLNSNAQALIPIAINDQVLGVIDIQSEVPRAFDADTVDIFQTMASQIATGLRNIILLESAQGNLEETSLVYRASRQITQSESEPAALNILADSLSQTNYSTLILDVLPEHLQVNLLRDKRGSRMDAGVIGLNLPIQQRGFDRLAENRVILQDNLMAPSDFSSLMNFFIRRECKSVAVIPIMVAGKPAKVLALGSRESTPLTSASMQSFASLAEVFGNTLSRFRATHTMKARLNELELMASVSDAVAAQTDLATIYRLVKDQFTSRLGDDLTFLVALHDKAKAQIILPYAYEDGQEITNLAPFAFGEGFSSHIISTGQPILVTKDIEKVKSQLGSKTLGKSALCLVGVPLSIGGTVIGAILLQDNKKEERFNNDDLHLLSTVSIPIANAIHNAQLVSELQHNLSAYTQEHYLLNTLLENIPGQIFIKDDSGKYLRVSKSYEKVAGLPANQLIGRTENEVKGELGLQTMMEEAEILSSRLPEIGRLIQSTREDGSDQWALSSRMPLVDPAGQTFGLLGIYEDVTDLKLTEQLAQRRAEQLRTAAAVARDTAGTLDTRDLLRNSVNIIRDRYGFYHAGIFLLDALKENAVLEEATGEAGKRMKEAGHKLAVGSLSIVGRTANTRKPVVSNDVRKEISYFPNPLLPNTRSEVGIPLIAGDEMLGVLDVQSEKVNAFLEEDINILQTVADQLSIALMNARLYAQTQEHLAKHRLLHHITAAASAAGELDAALATTVQSLRAALSGDQVAIYFLQDDRLVMRASAGYGDEEQLLTQIKVGEGIIGSAAQEHRPIRVNDIRSDTRYLTLDTRTASELAVPILFNEQLLGVLNIESPRVAAYDENDQEILATLGSNLASIIANTKLVEQVRVQVERQRQLYEVTSKIRRSTDLRTILETSAAEIGRLLRANAVKITVNPETSSGTEQEEEA